ncbi:MULTISPECIES: hypothetical protein [unclassified Burkholderia]|uniref:hypothetical protein n=1 Tax=unclassified Burkholderia TaxID=2613784 RepID=UPI0015C5DB14|nr:MULTISPECIES: hypothetical protein [unclassified Burkholderia]MDN7428147.1 hypothetical protein [Burkholderia sp. AU45388]
MINLFAWKLAPERWNGGIKYIQAFKDAWIMHNKSHIRAAAGRNRLPREMLAGICWIEVGGDPEFIDRVAFEVRTFDWSGPPFVDRHPTLTRHPAMTSFGPVSMQLRTAAQTLGILAALRSTHPIMHRDANMARLLRFVIHVACVIGLLVVITITGSKYAWMHEIDPSVAVDAIKDEAGDHILVSYALLMVVAITQVVLLKRAGAAGAKPWIGFLILAATVVCAWRAIS